MSDTRTVAVKLRADTRTYQTSMKDAANQTTKFDAAQQKAQRNTQRWEVMGMAARIGGAALAAGLLAATKAASDQEQAMGSLTAVFKTNGAAMTANAKNSAQLGLSTTDYANAAAKLGAQLSNLGVTQANLGGTTDDLIRKASDLAAQFGGTTQEAVDALGAAMRGEADPAERYGLALQVTAINAEMAATGADKATAIMALLNKQMTKSGAIGAWNREMDTAASKTQVARAEFDNATAALGESLLPAMAAAEGAASDLLSKFNNMSDGAKQATTYIAAVGAAALVAGPKILEMSLAVNKLANSGVALAGLARSAAMLGGAVAAAEGFVAAIGGITGKAGELTGLPDVFNAIRDAIIGMTPGLGPGLWLRDTMDQLGLAGLGWNKLTGQTTEAKGALRETSIAAFRAALGVKESGDAAQSAADASMADVEAKEAQAAALKKATEQYEAYIAAVQQALNLLSARDALIGQEDRLAEAVKKNGNALKGQTAAAAANRAAIAAEVTNITELVQAKYEETGSLKAANRVRKEQIANLLRSAEAAGMDRQETRALLKQLDLLKPINTSVTVDGLGPATAQAKALARALGKVVQNSGLANFGIGQNRAAGGYITGPGTGTSDDIPANLSNGEYVLRASAVRRIGVDELDAMNYARGGKVRRGRGGDGGRGRSPARGGGSGPGRAHAGGGGSGPGRAHAGGGGSDMGFGQAVKAIERWQDKVEKSKQKLADLKRESADYANTITQGILASSGGGLFDMFKKSDIEANAKKAADAADNVAAATRRLYDAQVKANEAAPEERAAALKELADAQRDLATATGEQAQAQAAADASAPTADNILGKMKGRAAAIENYASKVKALMGRGLSIELIKELAGADMLEAGPVLDALLAMPADALAELGSLDKRAKDAAASVGSAVSGAAFAPQMAQAETELSVNTDGLEDALDDADKTLTKDWRKVIANAGLSAKEHASLLQSLRNNDGKLTRYWRNKLAMAGLGAEERKELMDAITGGDTTMGREWRDKLQKTGLSAEEKDELAAELANAKNPERALRKYWLDELQETGLSAKESASLYDEIANTKKPGRKLRAEWIDQLQETGLSAKEAADMVAKIQATNKKVDDDFNNRTNEAKLKAAKDAGFDTTVTGAATAANSVSGDKVAKLYANKVGDPEGNAKSVKDAADAVKGDYTAKLKSEKVDTPVERAQETGTNIAAALVKDFTGKLKSEKVGEPIENAETTGTKIGAAIARDFTAKLKLNPGTVVDDANQIGRALGAALMAGINKGKQKKPRTRQFSSTAEDEEMTADTTIGVAADDSIHTETDGAMRFVERKWSDNTFRAKLGIKVAGDFGADLQAIKNAVAWALNTPPVTMQIATQTVTTSATGGLITGAGTATSDSIPALLSNGEYVVRAASVAKYGAGMLEAINTGRYASGGPVGYRTTTTANPSTSIGSAVVTSTVPVIVQIDGRAIAQSQLKVQRQSGGTITVGG